MKDSVSSIQENYTIVSDKKSLIAATFSGCDIVVSGIIDMGDEEILLHDTQKLVGEGYFSPGCSLSKITFNKKSSARGIVVGNNCEISDLSLELTTVTKNEIQGLICNDGKSITLRNIDLCLTDSSDNYLEIGAIVNTGVANTNLEGYVNIQTSGNGEIACGIFSSGDDANVVQAADGELFITTLGCFGVGISGGNNFLAGTVNIITKGNDGFGFYGGNNTFSGAVNVVTLGQDGLGIRYGSNTLTSTCRLMIDIQNVNADVGVGTFIRYSSGAQFGIKNARIGTDSLWVADGFKKQKSFGGLFLTFNDLKATDGWKKIGRFSQSLNTFSLSKYNSFAKKVEEHIDNDIMGGADSAYNATLANFNNIISSANYNGVNLLLGDSLDVGIDIEGVNANFEDLGISKANWKSRSDVEKSIAEINSAIAKLQEFSSKFSSQSSLLTRKISSIRKDFFKYIN